MTAPAAGARWTPATAVARLVEVAHHEGARSVWFKLLGELCYRRLGLFELRLDGTLPSQPAASLPLSFMPYSDAHARDFAALGASDPARTRARLSAGHSCYLARSGEQLVGACWIARGELWSDYLQGRIALAPDEACTYETYTAPAARGQGVGPALGAWVLRELRSAGCIRLLATVYPENAAALRLVEKLGYRRIGTLGWIGVGRRRRRFCRTRHGARAPGSGAREGPLRDPVGGPSSLSEQYPRADGGVPGARAGHRDR